MPRPPTSSSTGLYLAIDSGSPTVSVALGPPGEMLATRSVGIRGSSEALLAMIHEVLEEAGITLRELRGIVALAGPGSFTGLRVGLATAVGLHLASGVPATTLRTLDILALQGSGMLAAGTLVAAVDAQRGEWAFSAYEAGAPPKELASPITASAETIAEQAPDLLIGFGCEALPADLASRRVEPTPLACTALDWLSITEITWDASVLHRPIYSRPPAVSKPR